MSAPYYFYKYPTLHPEVFQAQLMSKFVQGKFIERGEITSPFMRAQVISWDNEGGKLENPAGDGMAHSRNPSSNGYYSIKARVGPKNPPRSIRARIVTEHRDANTSDDELRVYWPLFPSMGMDPVTLDFVYVFFESGDRRHGLWVARVPGPMGEETNFSPGDKPYKDAADDGGGQQSAASAFGDKPAEKVDYTTQEAIVGKKSDEASLTKADYGS